MKNKILKSGAVITAVICIEKVLGFVKQVIFAAIFGSNAATDIYYIAQNIVSIANTCFNRALPMSFLSVYSVECNKQTEKEKNSLMSNMINTGVLLSVALSLIVFLLAPYVVNLFESQNQELLVMYVRMLSIIVILYCGSGLLGAALECNENFIPSKMASLFVSTIEIVCILLLGHYVGVIAAIGGIIFGLVLHIIYEWREYKKKHEFYFLYLRRDIRVRKMLVMSIPIMLSTALSSINSLIDKFLAGNLGNGVISALNYANLVSTDLVSAVMVTAMSSIIVVSFAKCVANEDWEELECKAGKISDILIGLVGLIVILYIVNAKDIISIVFKRGAFGDESVAITAEVFIGYSIGLLFLPVREIIIRVQYAFHDSKWPMINSIICMVINVVISVVLCHFIGAIGISIGTSAAVLASSWLNCITCRKVHGIAIKLNFINMIKIVIAMGVTGLSNLLLTFVFCDLNYCIRFFICAILGVIIYFLALTILKYDSLKTIFGMCKSLFRKC